MSFWRSVPGAAVLVVSLGLAVGLGVVAVRVYEVIHPARVTEEVGDLGAELAKAEPVTFNASDGVTLDGWVLAGKPGQPAIVLCHDLGGSKNQLINIGIVLNQAGFTVLAFDFRGHGASGGDGSTLGIAEARDVIGAVDYVIGLAKDGVDVRKIGAYGTGMGAHAVVLAAAERSALRVLVLDGLWPDPRWALTRRTFPEWPFAIKHLGAIPAGIFSLLSRPSTGGNRAADVLPHLSGRSVLLVAPAGDGKLDVAMKAMYDSLPEQRDSERGLLTLPATQGSGLSAADLARYHERVVEFFKVRLARP
jgi:uncharacterized protein